MLATFQKVLRRWFLREKQSSADVREIPSNANTGASYLKTEHFLKDKRQFRYWQYNLHLNKSRVRRLNIPIVFQNQCINSILNIPGVF